MLKIPSSIKAAVIERHQSLQRSQRVRVSKPHIPLIRRGHLIPPIIVRFELHGPAVIPRGLGEGILNAEFYLRHKVTLGYISSNLINDDAELVYAGQRRSWNSPVSRYPECCCDAHTVGGYGATVDGSK
ncbi:hypothetical protein ABW19_dt0210606 [Dactylella cylindrospora]|nr:hypothetical protein ABW19_dt0210606 [Dactylella cylindrospora]